MSTRPMSPPPASSNAESDLDSTAELPVLDPAAASSAAEPHTLTDTWASPPARTALPAAADADAVRLLEANLQSVSAALQSVTTQLHEAQELLASRGERLTELERVRDEARAELAAAQRRTASLEQHNAALSAELAQRHDADTRQAAQLEEANRARAAAERRAAAAGAELATTRTLASEASERAGQLQSRLEQYHSESRTQRSQELEQQQALAVQNRAHVTGMMEDLHYERARALSYLESLQSLESRRLIAESLVTDLQHEAELRESDRQRLARELASHQSRALGLDAELEQRTASIARLEQQVGAVSAALESARNAAAAAAARTASQEALLAEQRQNAITLQAESDAHAARVRELEADLRADGDPVQRLGADAQRRGASVASDAAANPALRDAVRRRSDDGVAQEPPLDGATRLLIHSEGGREIVHVLGRKTSIGRTPDNDLQVVANFVSRHHAVILAGPAQTIIEDLNSTNGVQVNGRRITRTTLRDGDQIAIGRAQYRFAVREAADKY